MAVTYRELLGTRYFRKFRVEAGTKGLEKKIGLVLTCEEALSDKNSYVFLCKMSYHQKEISLDFVREIIERGYSGLGVQKEDGEPFDPEIRKFCEENN
ncbi:MAG TPA: PucR family transcriptional regulator ligand-binding domain-containing protein, partial [Candidatus Dorea gallistercoris]|nr:PucR family transcriptional regulator ligand-binding domain-containing protein [Candidatus Dorea gallistercoris]